MKIEDVIKGRIEYAKQRAAQLRNEAARHATAALEDINNCEYMAGQQRAVRAHAARVEADAWEQCARELLEPIASFVESR